jgi:predicted nucleic acid-binding protein
MFNITFNGQTRKINLRVKERYHFLNILEVLAGKIKIVNNSKYKNLSRCEYYLIYNMILLSVIISFHIPFHIDIEKSRHSFKKFHI